MNKSILSVAIIAATSFGAMADDSYPTIPDQKKKQAFEEIVESQGVDISRNGDGSLVTLSAVDKDGNVRTLVVDTTTGKVTSPVGGEHNHVIGEDSRVTTGKAIKKAKEIVLKDNIKTVKRWDARQEQRRDEMALNGGLSQEGKEFLASKVDSDLVMKRVGDRIIQRQLNGGEMGETGKKILEDNFDKDKAAARQNQRELERNPAPIDPVTPIHGGDGSAKEQVGKYAKSAAAEAQSQGASTMADLYSATSDNALAIHDLYNQVDRLDEKMDGVMAGTHAVNNARPFLSGEGQTAVGVGVGYAGESGAVAIGAAHSFTENWSASATLNVTTGSYSEVSGGAGIQYVF